MRGSWLGTTEPAAATFGVAGADVFGEFIVDGATDVGLSEDIPAQDGGLAADFIGDEDAAVVIVSANALAICAATRAQS